MPYYLPPDLVSSGAYLSREGAIRYSTDTSLRYLADAECPSSVKEQAIAYLKEVVKLDFYSYSQNVQNLMLAAVEFLKENAQKDPGADRALLAEYAYKETEWRKVVLKTPSSLPRRATSPVSTGSGSNNMHYNPLHQIAGRKTAPPGSIAGDVGVAASAPVIATSGGGWRRFFLCASVFAPKQPVTSSDLPPGPSSGPTR